MTITERLFQVIKQKNIKQTELAESLNIKPQIINNWKSRGTTPPMEYLPLICDTLGISWEWLVTGRNSGETYTQEEKYLVSTYRNTNDFGKTKIIEYAQDMAHIHPAQTEKETNFGTKTG